MTGMDPKILAAVFASIAAIAAGTGGSGTFDNFQDIQPEELIGQFTESPSNIISGLREKPEPKNPVMITAILNDKSQSLDLEAEKIRAKEFSKIISSSKNITSDEDITFEAFKGSLKFGKENLSRFNGEISGFESSGVTVSEKTDISAGTDAETIEILGVNREIVELNQVNVRISSLNDSTVIERDSSSVNINSFTGNITLDDSENRLELEGFVDQVEAGGTSFSG